MRPRLGEEQCQILLACCVNGSVSRSAWRDNVEHSHNCDSRSDEVIHMSLSSKSFVKLSPIIEWLPHPASQLTYSTVISMLNLFLLPEITKC